jgi:hypothetical protein
LIIIIGLIAIVGTATPQIEVMRERAMHHPYLIKIHVRDFDASGAQISEHDNWLARRSNRDRADGSKEVTSTGVTLERRHVRFMTQGLEFFTNSVNSNIMTWGKGKDHPYDDDLGSKGVDCGSYYGQFISGEQKKILGFRVIRAVEHDFRSDVEFWVAPDLDCEVVERTINWKKRSGAPDGYKTELATFLSASEPPDDLFAYPTNHIEVAPKIYKIGIGEPPMPTLDAKYEKDKQIRESNSK